MTGGERRKERSPVGCSSRGRSTPCVMMRTARIKPPMKLARYRTVMRQLFGLPGGACRVLDERNVRHDESFSKLTEVANSQETRTRAIPRNTMLPKANDR